MKYGSCHFAVALVPSIAIGSWCRSMCASRRDTTTAFPRPSDVAAAAVVVEYGNDRDTVAVVVLLGRSWEKGDSEHEERTTMKRAALRKEDGAVLGRPPRETQPHSLASSALHCAPLRLLNPLVQRPNPLPQTAVIAAE